MASALLVSRAEPSWCERKVYVRKNSNPNPNPNPSPNHARKMAELGPGDFNVKESVHGGIVTFNIASFSKRELKDLKRRFVKELEEVRKLRNRIENEFGYQPNPLEIQETASVFQSQMHKGKNHKKRALVSDSTRSRRRMMDQCGCILKKLMGHKSGWVFNVPVDVVGMGLHDYHHIIKQPMDLGTVKSKLEQDVYSSPLDFASDVRLTFNNALTYNPQGHDVFFMATDLLANFEKMFATACKKFQNEQNRVVADAMSAQVMEPVQQHTSLPVSFKEKPPIPSFTPAPHSVMRYDRGPSTPIPLSKPPPPSSVPTPAQPPVQSVQPTRHLLETPNGKLPKPKARDVNKREMTFEEKQKLSKELQNLPQERMANAVQIMRRRNATLSQNDDEIEVDFEDLDKETLWELDRFVFNYKKMICNIKKQQDLEPNKDTAVPSAPEYKKSQVSEAPEVVVSENNKTDDPVCVEEDIDIGEEEIPTNTYPPIEIEKDVGIETSSSSDSSSTDSSSSSGSDSGSSSDGDSEADNAPSSL